MPEWPQPVSTTRPRPRTCATSAWSSRISGSGCQRPSPVGLVAGEAALELGGPVDLAGDEQRAVEQERRLRAPRRSRSRPLERAAARRRQLHRLAAGKRDAAAAPELGVDEHRERSRGPSSRDQAVHARSMWSQCPWLSTTTSMSRGDDLEAAHVLDQPVGGDPGVEQHAGLAAAFGDVDEARRTRARRAERRPRGAPSANAGLASPGRCRRAGCR